MYSTSSNNNLQMTASKTTFHMEFPPPPAGTRSYLARAARARRVALPRGGRLPLRRRARRAAVVVSDWAKLTLGHHLAISGPYLGRRRQRSAGRSPAACVLTRFGD